MTFIYNDKYKSSFTHVKIDSNPFGCDCCKLYLGNYIASNQDIQLFKNIGCFNKQTELEEYVYEEDDESSWADEE